MVNAMNKVLKDCIPNITMPFLDDIPIKGCSDKEKNETKDKDGCRRFVLEQMKDCEKVLQRLEDANLTFSGEKSAFKQPKILVVGHLCGAYGRKPQRHERRMHNPNGGSKIPRSVVVKIFIHRRKTRAKRAKPGCASLHMHTLYLENTNKTNVNSKVLQMHL